MRSHTVHSYNKYWPERLDETETCSKTCIIDYKLVLVVND